jgi:glycosyltransferase 2 family protein
MRARSWLRLLAGALVLGVLLQRFGTGPFVDAWRLTTWWAVLAALVLTALATVTSAWRWRVVAARLGVPLAPGRAICAYYRSQFLNATLPGGILGDAHRAVRHGREAGDLPAGLRATMWERVAGQVMQVALTVLALLLLPSPLRPLCPVAVAAGLVVGSSLWWLRHRGADRGASRDATTRRGFLAADVRALLDRRTAPRIALASTASTAAHLALFMVAVRAVGVDAPVTVLVPTGLLVLVVSSVPLSIAGWGPREGVTAWAFGFAGLGAGNGLTVSVVYGVLVAVATLPGVAVLLSDALFRRRTGGPRDGSGERMDQQPVLEEVRRG